MKNYRTITATLFVALFALAGFASGEDYPGQDRQLADQLESQANDAIENAKNTNSDTREARFLFEKGKYEISAGHGPNAQRFFRMSMDALRPETAPITESPAMPEVGTAAPVAPAAAPSATASKKPAVHHHAMRHHKQHHHHHPPVSAD